VNVSGRAARRARATAPPQGGRGAGRLHGDSMQAAPGLGNNGNQRMTARKARAVTNAGGRLATRPRRRRSYAASGKGKRGKVLGRAAALENKAFEIFPQASKVGCNWKRG